MKQVEADVAIVAAGPAGLAAAVAAAEKGARVVVFEKSNVTGGCGNMAMGPFGVESRLQKKQVIGITRDEAFKIHMDFNHWIPDARLVRAFIDKSGNTIDWLEDMGVEFIMAARHFPLSEPTWHILKENGRAIGIQAVDAAGETIQANAKAVIVATGGFGGNAGMIKEITGYEWGKDLFSFKIPGIEGEGLKMAWEAGAARTHMILEMYCSVPRQGDFWNLDVVFRQPNLLVNLDGERFFNEEVIQNNTFAGNAISGQKGRCAFMIIDEAIKKQYVKGNFDQICFDIPIEDAAEFDDELERATEEGTKDFFAADSIEELAELAGINPENLLKTVADYNRACASRDALFNKNYAYMKPIRKARFYAGKLAPSGFGSLGGIKINHKAEVQDEAFNVIQGLYAAGTDANSIHSDSYTFIMPGNTMGFAINSGRIAGESAADFVDSLR